MYTRGNLDGFSSQLSKCNSEIINRRQIKGELT